MKRVIVYEIYHITSGQVVWVGHNEKVAMQMLKSWNKTDTYKLRKGIGYIV